LGRARDAAAKSRDALSRGAQAAQTAAAKLSDLAVIGPGPTVPLVEPWGVGFGQLLGRHPRVPDQAAGLLRRIDRLGSLSISAEAIGFDGTLVRWADVEQITLGAPLQALTSTALHHEIGRVSALLPMVPFRERLVRRVVDLFVALCLAVARRF